MIKTPEEMAEEYIEDHDECEHAGQAFLAGYQAAELKAKIEFAAKYDHKSPLQVIAAEYVKRRGTTGPLALLEENRFIDGYEAGLHASQPQWISVKDRLPPPEVKVLWWNETADQAGVSSYKYMSHCNDTMIEWGDAGNISIKNFTHWMPLPKPPEE